MSIWRSTPPPPAPPVGLSAHKTAMRLHEGVRPTVAELLIRHPQGWRELEPLALMMRDARASTRASRDRPRLVGK